MHYATKTFRTVAYSLCLMTSLAACYSTEIATAPSPDLALSNSALGNVLTGLAGKTLYFFAADANGQSACSGTCLEKWSTFYNEKPLLGTGLTASDFSFITRADGNKQTTFRGWPLYYYNADSQRGDVGGDNLANLWYVAKTNYTVMIGSGQLQGNDGKQYTKDYKEGVGNTLYLTDGVGKTLYAFAFDKRGTNNYTKADLSNNGTWPLFQDELKSIPSVLKASDFARINTKATGQTQITYKGWPIYYFGSDAGVRGATKGISFPKPGVWPIVYADSPDAPL